ncbi:MAG: hypothetical protein COX88_00985 [Candidatus Nealsonbacteria bacterium CG_4_10_14_0_2_um_filter_35_20]|nr:MAG: hypothetical protein COX88_00985 [Candidatus Nealsonbacteria bacterium CG_4_10_14_0_2_um_filter_35_20]
MLSENELIKKIQELKQIQPNQNWAVLTENKILSATPSFKPKTQIFSLNLFYQPAFAIAFSCFILIGLVFGLSFTVAQNTVPGDTLYSLKKFSENVQMVFVAPQEKPVAILGQAQKRLAELSKITQENKNQGKKLAASIGQTQESLSEVSKTLKGVPDLEKETIAEKVVLEIESIKGQQKAIEESIQADIMNEGQEESLVQSTISYYNIYLEKEIEKLKNSTLTKEQELLLEEAENELAQGNIERALEIVVKEIPPY